ncbi:MAG: hypothetical protein HZB91_14745 [Elusimicrobia bacterium]|nr:hypothetical protein [Elusimicrobiota bacterium]
MGYKSLRRPLAVLVISALLVSSQGFAAVSAVAQTVTTANTGKSAPISIPTAGSFSGLQTVAAPGSFSPSAISFSGSISNLPAAPLDITPNLGQAEVAGTELPALAAPFIGAQAAAASAPEFQGRPAVEAAPSLGAATLPTLGTPASNDISRTGLTGLQRLSAGLSKIGASLSLRRFFDGSHGAAVLGGEGLSPSATRGGSLASKFEPDLGKVKVYLTRHGLDPVETDLKSLSGLLSSDPGYLESLNKKGRVRSLSTSARALPLYGARSCPRSRLRSGRPSTWSRRSRPPSPGRAPARPSAGSCPRPCPSSWASRGGGRPSCPARP